MRSAAETKNLCYKAIGVTPNQVSQFPKLTSHLRTIGGKARALEYLRASSHPFARRFCAIYDDIILPAIVRRTLPLEAFCVAAHITSEQFLFAISQSAREMKQYEGSIKAAEVHPAIVQKSSELALEGDTDHITLNMKHMGFLPLPKGSQVSVNVNASANAQSAAQSATVLAPSPENTIRRLVNRFNLPTTQPAQLPEPRETVPTIMPRDMAYETVESEYEEEESSTATDMSSDE